MQVTGIGLAGRHAGASVETQLETGSRRGIELAENVSGKIVQLFRDPDPDRNRKLIAGQFQATVVSDLEVIAATVERGGRRESFVRSR